MSRAVDVEIGDGHTTILVPVLGAVHAGSPLRQGQCRMRSGPGSQELRAPKLRCAAEYVRMSTDGQQYSIDNQQSAIREYASRRGFEIVRTYSDAGRSGLTLEARPGLAQLLADVVAGQANFEVIVVFDVSRWGRFQDTDESAHYEFLCRRSKVAIEYCAEPFGTEGGPLAALMKSLKRSMAAEYSRDLSERIRQADRRLASRGFFIGGDPGYGLRRLLVARDGTPKGILERGMWKAVHEDHTVLAMGPAEEIRTVRRIFRLFVDEERTPAEIAHTLNAEGIMNAHGRLWDRDVIRRLVACERYVGRYVYARRSETLGTGRVRNSPETWIRVADAVKPIISQRQFAAAQAIIAKRSRRYSPEEMTTYLQSMLKKHGYLSYGLLKESTKGPPLHTMLYQFGGRLEHVFAAIGYRPSGEIDPALNKRKKRIKRIVRTALSGVAARLQRGRLSVLHDRNTETLTVGDTLSVAFNAATYVQTVARKRKYWVVSSERRNQPELTVIVRMVESNRNALDYWVLPTSEIRRGWMRLEKADFARLRLSRCGNIAKLVSVLLAAGN